MSSDRLSRAQWEPRFNSATNAKVELRKQILAALGKKSPWILDVYAGPGTMWRKAYDSTPNYVGLDKTQYDDRRTTFVCENTRFLRLKTFDVNRFDVYDLDAYGAPWYPLAIICKRIEWTKERDRVAVILTDGGGFNAKMNSLSNGFLRYLGLSRHRGSTVHHLHRENILRMAIEKSCADANAEPESILIARKDSGSGMRYIAYIMRGVAR